MNELKSGLETSHRFKYPMAEVPLTNLTDTDSNKIIHPSNGDNSTSENQEEVTVPLENTKAQHIRKSLRPRRIPIPVQSETTKNSNKDINAIDEPTANIGRSVRRTPKEPTAKDTEGERRKSLRPRRKVQLKEAYQDDRELDHLLSDEVNLQAYGPAANWNTGSGDYLSENWISVEKILAHRPLSKRKRTKFILEAVSSFPLNQQRMVRLEYFVKFHDQSYWHCAWMSGAIILALHPGLVRNYCRNVSIDEMDDPWSAKISESARKNITGSDSHKKPDANGTDGSLMSKANERTEEMTSNPLNNTSPTCVASPVRESVVHDRASSSENEQSSDTENRLRTQNQLIIAPLPQIDEYEQTEPSESSPALAIDETEQSLDGTQPTDEQLLSDALVAVAKEPQSSSIENAAVEERLSETTEITTEPEKNDDMEEVSKPLEEALTLPSTDQNSIEEGKVTSLPIVPESDTPDESTPQPPRLDIESPDEAATQNIQVESLSTPVSTAEQMSEGGSQADHSDPSRNVSMASSPAERVPCETDSLTSEPVDLPEKSVVSHQKKKSSKPVGTVVDRSELVKDGAKQSSITILHSSEEETDIEDYFDHWKNDSKENVQIWTSSKLDRAGSRRRYLANLGVEPLLLIPERIISISDTDSELQHDDTFDFDSLDVRTSNMLDSIEYREVLVKWLNVPYNQVTWETVELNSDHLDVAARVQKRVRYFPLRDACGRRLLPMVVRRHLVQLTEAHYTRIAHMLCEAYGSQTTIGKRPPPKFGDWKQYWTSGQPSYLSPEMHGKLFPYQLEGVRWLWHAYHNHVNAILADEMGLGKTVQVVSLLYSLWKERNDYGPFLIIAPLSTLLNWEREFKMWAPEFHVLVYTGDRNVRATMQDYEFRIPGMGNVAAFHILITSHELACIERSSLQGFDWSALIVDEAHRLKNKQSRLFKETSQYKAGFKMLLTGTPLQNNLEELFHLLCFVEPKTETDFKILSEQWADMSKELRISSLHDQLKNHLIRRLKADVIQDLPKKSELSVMVDMSVLQRKLYKLILTKNYEELRCGNLMNSLVHLQKVCDHPYLLPVGDAIAPRVTQGDRTSAYEAKALVNCCGKLVLLMEMLRGLKEQGHRVLIYSRMTSLLDLLEEALTNEEYAYERIDGRVKGAMRQIIIDRFNEPNCETFIFLLSTRSGGEGINLATADTVILYDSDWNPHCDLQALSRAHRIGQSRHVMVYRFITRHSLEERINAVARRKLALTNLVVDQREQRIQQKTLNNNTAAVTEETAMSTEDSTPAESGSNATEDANNTTTTASVPAAVTPSMETATTSAANLPRSGSNRLHRNEINDMLRCGLDALFAVDDMLDENELHKAARDSADTSNNADDSKRIVYDAQAVARLLDRANLEADCTPDCTRSAADEYLSQFRVAHFDTVSETVEEQVGSTMESSTTHSLIAECETPVEGTVDSEQEQQQQQQQNTVDQPRRAENIAEFWDKLLRDRYNRLCTAEAEALEANRRTSKVSWKLHHRSGRGSRSPSPSSSVELLGATDDLDVNEAGHDAHPGVMDDETLDYEEDGQYHRRSMENPDTMDRYNGFKGPRLLTAGSNGPSGRGRRIDHLDSGGETKRKRGRGRISSGTIRSRGSAGRRRAVKPTRRLVENDGDSVEVLSDEDSESNKDIEEDGDELGIEAESDADPSYVPSDDDDLRGKPVTHRKLVSKWRKRNKMTKHEKDILDLTENEDLPPTWPMPETAEEAEEFGNLCNDKRVTASWYPNGKVCAAWRDVVNRMGPKLTWENKNLFIYGFGPDDRQAFADTVMRYGLPPPGIVPPQDWLPQKLLHKSQPRLFAYTTLFMQHLYDDPLALDDSFDHWTDGLPKEKLCPVAVLSRVAMLSLIRNKVIQFEDINGVHSRTFEAVSTRFKFSIHEGGLTLLRPTWYEEWQRINTLVDSIRSKPSTSSVLTPAATTTTGTSGKTREESMYYLQHTWHSRHDYWLLAGTMVHGYMQWGALMSDPRFHLIKTGLAGTLEGRDDPSKKQNTRSVTTTPHEHAFLTNRLRLLEQALLVEQALYEVARSALQAGDNNVPQLVRVQSLAVCLSNKLASAQPRKRIALPRDPKAREATRQAVLNLQYILEDLHADLPGLPASVISSEPDAQQSTSKGNEEPEIISDSESPSSEPVEPTTATVSNPPSERSIPPDDDSQGAPDVQPPPPSSPPPCGTKIANVEFVDPDEVGEPPAEPLIDDEKDEIENGDEMKTNGTTASETPLDVWTDGDHKENILKVTKLSPPAQSQSVIEISDEER